MMVMMAVSVIAATINLLVAATTWYFSRVPGWKYYRTFSLVCLMLCIYALNSVWFVAADSIGFDRAWRTQLGLFLAIAASGLLILFNRQQSGLDLTIYDKVTIAVLVCFGIVVVIPGVAIDGYDIVNSVGIRYQIPRMTMVGNWAIVLALLCMLTVVYRYLRAAIRGEPGAWINTFGFSMFVLFAMEEALVAARVLNWPFLLDWGFATMVLMVAVDLSAKVARNSREIGELNNDLVRRVEKYSAELANTQEELFVAERQVAIEQLAGGIGHDINNPLGSIGGNLAYLRDRIAGEEGLEEEEEAIDEAIEGVQRIHRIVSDLTLPSHGDNSEDEIVDPRRAIELAIRLVAPEYRANTVFSVSVSSTMWAEISESKLTQVLLNLLTNAVHAVEAAGDSVSPVEIRCSHQEAELRIEVSDKGGGVDEDLARRIFDPLFTTKTIGKGTGLGLYVSRSIVESVGGSLALAQSSSEGTTMQVSLRAIEPDKSAVVLSNPRVGTTELAEVEGVRVYLIDDEAMVARAIQRMARKHHFVIESDSEMALEHLLEGHNYDLILCDLMMPRLTGMELYRRLIGARPELRERIVFITGGAVTSDAQAFVELPQITVLTKPLRMPTLLKTIAKAGLREYAFLGEE